jgi:hypothetical protein
MPFSDWLTRKQKWRKCNSIPRISNQEKFDQYLPVKITRIQFSDNDDIIFIPTRQEENVIYYYYEMHKHFDEI